MRSSGRDRIGYYKRYVAECRDINFLRLLESFMESAPQLVLQLYILLAIKKKIELETDWILLICLVNSVVSLALAIVFYTKALKLCVHNTKEDDSWRGKAFAYGGLAIQAFYLLVFVGSRIAAFVLFASIYKLYLFVLTTLHWLAMFIWIRQTDTRFCSKQKGSAAHIHAERFVSMLIAIIYIFCFINFEDGRSRNQRTIYYFLFLAENSMIAGLFYINSVSDFGWLQYTAFAITFGGFFLGLACMLCYYKFLHPSLRRDKAKAATHAKTVNSNEDQNMYMESETRRLITLTTSPYFLETGV